MVSTQSFILTPTYTYSNGYLHTHGIDPVPIAANSIVRVPKATNSFVPVSHTYTYLYWTVSVNVSMYYFSLFLVVVLLPSCRQNSFYLFPSSPLHDLGQGSARQEAVHNARNSDEPSLENQFRTRFPRPQTDTGDQTTI